MITAGEIFSQPFTQVTLPILLGFWIASLFQNKRFDDLNKRFDDIGKRFDDIGKLITAESARLEASLKLEIAKVEMRVKALEERSGLIFRG